MTEFNSTLHNMPSEEHLTARKATKLKFVQLESDQLCSYMEDLESSLRLYKQILHEIMPGRGSEQSLSDESETQSFMSSRLFESLLTEKRSLEERLRKNILSRNEAAKIAAEREQLLSQSQSKEEALVKDYEKKIADLLHESEYKERIIKDLQSRNSILERDVELYNKSKEKMLSVQDQKELLKKKGEAMVGILVKLEKKYEILYRDIQNLMSQCNNLASEYQRGNNMLREPQPEISTEGILNFPNRDLSCDEFWVTEDKNLKKIIEELGITSKKTEDICYTLSSPKNASSNMSKLEKKQEKLKKKCDEYQIKLQTITQEIQSAKRLKRMLVQDQEHLKAALLKNKAVEKELEIKLHQKNPVNDREEGVKRNMRSNSNPLDYAQFTFNEGAKVIKKKEVKPEEFKEVHDEDVSLILPQNEDMMEDSLMDIFDADEKD
jgi:chromosome segregation ATPase